MEMQSQGERMCVVAEAMCENSRVHLSIRIKQSVRIVVHEGANCDQYHQLRTQGGLPVN